MSATVERDAAGGGATSWDRDPVLTVEHLTMRFGGLVAVSDLSFNVGRGEITALIGPNGAGKTTVFNCVTGFYKPTEGRIVMRHGPGRQEDTVEEVTDSGAKWKASPTGAVYLLERMPDFEISKHAKVARTFQNIRLFGGMTVLENLLVAQHNPLMIASAFTIGGIFGIPGFKRAEQNAIEKAVHWLEQVDLVDRADDPAADLPYGAQRRLEIARAMCTEPQLLCLDEPAAGLNPRESTQLNQLLQSICASHNTSVLLIEHDMGVVMEISDHIVVLDYGVKIADGDADAVRTDPSVIAAYLGVEDEDLKEEPEIRDVLVEAIGVEAAAKADIPVSEAAGKKPRNDANPAAKPKRSDKSTSDTERNAGTGRGNGRRGGNK
jgi:branched-chain amino acid transport system ATP-binding protein